MTHFPSLQQATNMKPFAISAKSLLAISCLLAMLAGCSSPPQAPTIDDSNKRPLNEPNTIALQSCRAELSVSKIALTEALTKQPLPARVTAYRAPSAPASDAPVTPPAPSSSIPAPAAASGAASSSTPPQSRPTSTVNALARSFGPGAQVSGLLMAPRPNTVFIIHFELGSKDVTVSPEQREELIRLARDSKYVVVRGRTDAKADTPLQTNLAKQRANAAFDYLTSTLRVPAEAIRVTWQGSGDALVAGDAPAQRQANRRVEIEFYTVSPQVDVVAR